MSQTAADAYAAHRADIARLLDVLGMELDKHAEAAKGEPGDWGRAGDLATVRSNLIGAVAFLAGMDPANVEAFLAE